VPIIAVFFDGDRIIDERISFDSASLVTQSDMVSCSRGRHGMGNDRGVGASVAPSENENAILDRCRAPISTLTSAESPVSRPEHWSAHGRCD
jgi:hypothetical protein